MLARGTRGAARDLHARCALRHVATLALSLCTDSDLYVCARCALCDDALAVYVRCCYSARLYATHNSRGRHCFWLRRVTHPSAAWHATQASRGRWLRSFSAAPSAPSPEEAPRVHGGLKDEDRIFTNLYCQGDPFIKVRCLPGPCPVLHTPPRRALLCTCSCLRRRARSAAARSAPAGARTLPCGDARARTRRGRAPWRAATGTAPRTWW